MRPGLPPPDAGARAGLVHRSVRRRVLFTSAAGAIALLLGLTLAEVGVRVIYRDGGTRTLGGPGGQEFVYRYIAAATERRAPTVTGPKAPGVERILVLGDSITWGIGVRDWQALYANRLLDLLKGSGRRYDMEVYAYGGKNIDGHARAVEGKAAELAPDFIIYQWYNNDIEINVQGPRRRLPWHRWAWHESLASRSSRRLPKPQTSGRPPAVSQLRVVIGESRIVGLVI